ncbi:MAG TPA: mechanosensitive ion channel family protein [Vicinamibacteria bacterium]|nr:mechanosensitive ion channel family protein [Vicinamibacteria bacterium]
MRQLLSDPRVAHGLLSALILAGSALAARLLSVLFARVLRRVAHRTPSTLDDHLVVALQRPLAAALFLIGAYVAVHRLPLADAWLRRLDAVLFVTGVFLLAVALVRSYGILLDWYGRESKAAATSLAVEFGPLFSKVGKAFIGLVAAITVLQHFGVNVASLVVSLGVGSLAVGLAAQDTLANMFAGFTLMLDRPFRVGDRIQLASGESGDVEAIGVRATLIRTPDETLLIVPNSGLVKERLINLSRPTRRQATQVTLGVGYGSDLALVRRILGEAVLASAHTDHEREPAVMVTAFADFAISVLVRFWVKDYMDVGLARNDVFEQAHRRLREAGIELPTAPLARAAREGELQARR